MNSVCILTFKTLTNDALFSNAQGEARSIQVVVHGGALQVRDLVTQMAVDVGVGAVLA